MLGGDPTILALGAELHEMRRFVSNGNSYARSGRAFMLMLSGICMHTQQRANMKRTSSCRLVWSPAPLKTAMALTLVLEQILWQS